VEVSSDYEDSVMVKMKEIDDQENQERTVHLQPDEIELLISSLNLYKGRIGNDHNKQPLT